MTAGRLITRDTELDAPDGCKVVLVFGTMVVPKDAPVGSNRVVEIEDNLTVNIEKSKKLPTKYALWDGPATAKEVLGIESMRDSGAVAVLDHGLSLVSQGDVDDKSMPKIVKFIEKNLPLLPDNDVMRTIMKAVLNVVAVKTAQPSTKPTRRKKA